MDLFIFYFKRREGWRLSWQTCALQKEAVCSLLALLDLSKCGPGALQDVCLALCYTLIGRPSQVQGVLETDGSLSAKGEIVHTEGQARLTLLMFCLLSCWLAILAGIGLIWFLDLLFIFLLLHDDGWLWTLQELEVDGCRVCIFQLKEVFAFVRESRFGKIVMGEVKWPVDPLRQR